MYMYRVGGPSPSSPSSLRLVGWLPWAGPEAIYVGTALPPFPALGHGTNGLVSGYVPSMPGPPVVGGPGWELRKKDTAPCENVDLL